MGGADPRREIGADEAMVDPAAGVGMGRAGPGKTGVRRG